MDMRSKIERFVRVVRRSNDGFMDGRPAHITAGLRNRTVICSNLPDTRPPLQ